MAEEQKYSRADYMKEYYWNNRERILEQQRARYKVRAERERERYRKYYTAHRADILSRRKSKYIGGVTSNVDKLPKAHD